MCVYVCVCVCVFVFQSALQMQTGDRRMCVCVCVSVCSHLYVSAGRMASIASRTRLKRVSMVDIMVFMRLSISFMWASSICE